MRKADEFPLPTSRGAVYRIDRDAAGQEHVRLEDIRWTA